MTKASQPSPSTLSSNIALAKESTSNFNRRRVIASDDPPRSIDPTQVGIISIEDKIQCSGTIIDAKKQPICKQSPNGNEQFDLTEFKILTADHCNSGSFGGIQFASGENAVVTVRKIVGV